MLTFQIFASENICMSNILEQIQIIFGCQICYHFKFLPLKIFGCQKFWSRLVKFSDFTILEILFSFSVFWSLIALDSMWRAFPCKGNTGQIFQKCVELDQELNGSLGVNPPILSSKFFSLNHMTYDIIILANPPIMCLTIGHKILLLPQGLAK